MTTAAQVQYNFTVILNPGAGTDKQYSFLYSCLQSRGFPLDYVAWADYHSSLPIDQLLAVHGHSSGAAEPPVCSGACSVMIAAANVLRMSNTLLAGMAYHMPDGTADYWVHSSAAALSLIHSCTAGRQSHRMMHHPVQHCEASGGSTCIARACGSLCGNSQAADEAQVV